jgi:DNA-binding transcriptional ArsR family regulator
MGSEEDTYSMIFSSLKHPIRRGILRILSGGPQTFSDLQKTFTIESSHLTYHLDGLGNLLLKTDDGRYALSSLGEAAVSTMKHVEEPPKATPHLQFPSKNWKLLMAAMLIGLVLLSALLILQYQSFGELSARYSNLSEEQKLLQEALKNVALYFGGTVVTNEHTMDGTIATAYLQKEISFTIRVYIMNVTDDTNETWVVAYSYSFNSTFGYPPLVGSNESAVYDLAVFNVTTPWGHNIDAYSIYTLTDNSTLKIAISVNSSQARAPLYMSMDESWNTANQTFTDSPESFFHIWDKEVTENATFSVPLRSAKHYVLRIEAPGLLDVEEHYEASYTISLGMESQGTLTPFIVGNRAEEASSGRFEGEANATSLLLSQQPFWWSDWVFGRFWVDPLNATLLPSP